MKRSFGIEIRDELPEAARPKREGELKNNNTAFPGRRRNVPFELEPSTLSSSSSPPTTESTLGSLTNSLRSLSAAPPALLSSTTTVVDSP